MPGRPRGAKSASLLTFGRIFDVAKGTDNPWAGDTAASQGFIPSSGTAITRVPRTLMIPDKNVYHIKSFYLIFSFYLSCFASSTSLSWL